MSFSAPALAQQTGYGQTLGTTPLERQVYEGGNGVQNGGGSILNSTNPLDLLNKMRRGTSLDDATPPSSAIDDALRQLEVQSPPTATNTTTPAAVASPVAVTAQPLAASPAGAAATVPSNLPPAAQPAAAAANPSL